MTDVAPAVEPDAPVLPDAPIDGGTSQYVIPDGLMAMTTDDGTVVTLLKRDPEHGAVIRHDGDWTPVTDPSTLDGLNFVGVVDGAVEIYDTYEADGSLVKVKHYPASEEGPFWTDISEDEGLVLDEETGEYSASGEKDQPEEKPVAASVTLDSAEDLDAAIVAATNDPDLQWYVERRVAALGLEASLPWLEV